MRRVGSCVVSASFSALQRAEIAEIEHLTLTPCIRYRFSALQRAEIAEMPMVERTTVLQEGFSALQRAEIAEIVRTAVSVDVMKVSVLFNEPKLLK